MTKHSAVAGLVCRGLQRVASTGDAAAGAAYIATIAPEEIKDGGVSAPAAPAHLCVMHQAGIMPVQQLQQQQQQHRRQHHSLSSCTHSMPATNSSSTPPCIPPPTYTHTNTTSC